MQHDLDMTLYLNRVLDLLFIIQVQKQYARETGSEYDAFFFFFFEKVKLNQGEVCIR